MQNPSRDASHTLGLITRWLKPDDVFLDIGCGDAEIGCRLEQMGYKSVYNIDFVDIRKFDVKNFYLYDGINLPFEDSFFDFISINFVLHHAPNDNKVKLMDEIKRVSKGIVFILEDTPRNLIDRIFAKIHGMDYKHRIKSKESFGFYSKEEWEDFFRSSGWEIITSERQNRFCRARRQPYSRTAFVIKRDSIS
jgi:SAM-dependent methyltransferase